MKESRVNRVFQWIVGILFIGFGLLYLLGSTVPIDITGWVLGGVIAVGALIRLIVICLPSSTSFPGSASLEIMTGICEAVFGIVIVLNALLYMEFVYPLIAALFVIMSIVRILQSARIKKSGQSGWGSYVFMAILFLLISAGLVATSYVIKIDLQIELIGAAAFLYGFFLVFSSLFKQGIGAPAGEEPIFEESAKPEAFAGETEIK
ncbi:MAG: hypothetical protein WCP73_02470 [Eubacteriales bacterium]